METDKWGRRIRAFRKLKGFTQETFAKEAGMSVSVLGELERGSRLPRDEQITRIAACLGISVDDLKPPKEE
ncbi:helix-turn-helix domain-containing protein [Mangrovibacillus cuniculi]|uniref:Helix-turn-helix transcriptional regulator n=1 Tax=Mangrovibacillus cuniculi TaxID=2593652 RepID=A0A7S8CDJ7_9BACI|nr:helix-turn-helix transcriptional regulator [Mangrovibacillus cuniculi]QPC48003.1 helix-turn-helix transcriptional regulator [Mangrovibacillus cuniculi]